MKQYANHKACAVYRGWVNQPSTLQPNHELHGRQCIVVDERDGGPCVRIYFTEGNIISSLVLRETVSPGSPACTKPK